MTHDCLVCKGRLRIRREKSYSLFSSLLDDQLASENVSEDQQYEDRNDGFTVVLFVERTVTDFFDFHVDPQRGYENVSDEKQQYKGGHSQHIFDPPALGPFGSDGRAQWRRDFDDCRLQCQPQSDKDEDCHEEGSNGVIGESKAFGFKRFETKPKCKEEDNQDWRGKNVGQ
jgi:hypothetical protein